MLTLWRVPVIAAGLLAFTGCEEWGNWGPSDRYREDFHYSYAMEPGGTVSLENFNGSVEIASWEQNTIEINGTKYASQKSYLDDMKIDVSDAPGSVHIRTVRPSTSHGGCGARYTIRVPRRVSLDEIVNTNGPIRVDRIDGTARLRTSNGSLKVEYLKGDLNARTSNGAIDIRDLDGNARVHTSNGAIDVEAAHGSFEAETSNGRIEVNLNDPTASWPVKLHSTNGHIDVTVRGSKMPELRAETTNSAITLHLPATASARVRASTSHHSSVTSEFDSLMHGGRDGDDDDRHRKSDIDGTIGGGGPLMDLSTTNGSIKILKL